MKEKLLLTGKLIGGIVVITILSFGVYMMCQVSTTVTAMNNEITTLKTALNKQQEKEEETEETEKEPQYVTIGNRYLIRDTSNISDAYRKNDSSLLKTQLDQETYDLASNIIKKVITDDMSLYEKEVAIHNWMVKNIAFESGSLLALPNATQYCDQPYGALKYGSAVCVGYATTFKLFMNMLGIDCMIVHDTEQSHSWNLVNLDGDWYLVDVTFDRNSNSTGISYRYFNGTDSSFADNHTWDTSLYPEATGSKYSYAAMNASKLDNISNLPKKIKKEMTNGVENIFYVMDQNTDLSYVSLLIDRIREFVSDQVAMEFSLQLNENNDYILCIYLNYYYKTNTNGINQLDQKTMNEIETLFSGVSFTF